MSSILELFSKSIEKDRLAHLYLLVGAQGEHKKKMAYEIAYLIASHYNDNPNLKSVIASNNYPNVVAVLKEGLVIKKEQILSLQEEFSKTSLVAGPRIYIIEAIETLTPAAANSLLKFMEDPRGNQTIGILLTDQKDLVLPTIISRSQVVYLNENNEKYFSQLLLENELSVTDSLILPFLTQDLSEALEYSQNYNYKEVIALFTKIISNWNNRDISIKMLVKESAPILYSDRKWIYLLLNLLLRFFLDIIEIELKQTPYLTFIDEQFKNVNKHLTMAKCEKNIKIIQKTLNKMNYYINLELATEAMLIDLEKGR